MAVTRRPANRRGEGDQLRADLIRAATDLLVAPQLVAPPSLRAIARQVGVSPSGVYLHFASQEDLLAAVIEAQYEELSAALAASDRLTADPTARLVSMARAYVRWGLAHPGAYQLLFESADALPDGPPPADRGDLLMDTVALLVRATGTANGAKARAVAMRIWVALHGLVSLRIHKPHASWPATAEREAGLLVRELLGVAEGRARASS
jgi:AcrR family transcriptional regulator